MHRNWSLNFYVYTIHKLFGNGENCPGFLRFIEKES